jgi:tetratricopeptide (TPR) repeat protein
MAFARVAELQEQSGDVAGAVKTWLHAADLHLRGHAADEAVRIWQHLEKVAPDSVAVHERLAKAYAGMNQTRKAIRQYLALAALYQQQGEGEQAANACQRALQLDPRDPDVLTALEALQQGRRLSVLVEERPASVSFARREADSDQIVGAASPVEVARRKALTDLAGALLEDNGFEGVEIIATLSRAIDLHTRGEFEAAIKSYERAINAGIRNVATFFNLGLLYQETLRFEEAIEQLQRAVGDPGYSLGAHFALGECLRALGRLDEAAAHFVEVLKQLDLSTVRPEQVDQLRQNYDALSHRYTTPEQRASVASFVNTLVGFLSGERWEERLLETRQHLNRLGSDGVVSLAEILTLPDYERILASMVKSQEFLEQGMLRSASEECLWAIEHAPDYLPLHLHLARLFMQGNQAGMAIDKYLAVADTWAARGEVGKSKTLYEQVLRIVPMNLDVRQRLIALMDRHQMVEKALEHRLALADAYYELAQIDASREQYNDALRLATRLRDNKEWMARILHRLGDINLQRLDWRSAIEVYLELKTLAPADVRAQRRLVELHFNLDRRAEALAELDQLIGLYRRQGNLTEALQMLEELAGTRPDELELHKRAAQLSVETGQKEGAIAHLDAMGELQLQRGHLDEAAATIKAIIALGPENVEAYRQLLEQIKQSDVK